jgi:Cys-rich four helix bundle protein (predicted Tat secretion target)
MPQTLKRRDLIKSAMLASAAISTTLAAQSVTAEEKGHHQHHSENKNKQVIDTALTCLQDGQACLDHCFILLKDGDTEMAKCAETVTEMLVLCDGLSKMASYRSSHLKEFAKVCAAVCQDCKDECKKHSDNHAACKACEDSCGDCIDACKKIV